MNDFLTVKQAAAKLELSTNRVRDLIRHGRLPAKKFGAMWIISSQDLDLVRVRKPGRPRKTV